LRLTFGFAILSISALPEAQPMSIEEVQRKLALAQQNADHYRKLAALPSLSFRASYAAQHMARSHQAAAKLYLKALTYERIREAVRVQRQGLSLKSAKPPAENQNSKSDRVGKIWVESPPLQP
jgi:hypothetical protein